MSTQSEAADQVVKIMLDGSEHAIKIAGAGAKQMAVLLYALLKDQKRTKGKMRLTNMLRSGKELRIFPVKTEDLKKFCKEAKKYGVLYCVLRQKNGGDGVVDIMARAEDASKINRIFEWLQITAVDMASVRTDLVQALENAADEAPTQTQDPEDAFVEELFVPAPQRDQMHTGNPTPAAGTESPDRSAPSSETVAASDFEPLRDRRSVRQELERIRREQNAGRRKTEQVRTTHVERMTPKRKENTR